MSLIDNLIGRLGYFRLTDGRHFYKLSKNNPYYDYKDKMNFALKNPIVYACIEIRAKVLAQCEFYIEKADGTRVKEHALIEKLKKPNKHQSKEDFLKQFEWFKSVFGWVYQKPYAATGSLDDSMQAIFNLNPTHIEFPKKFESIISWTDEDVTRFYEQEIIYQEDKAHAKRRIKLKDIIPFYDTGNGIDVDEKQKNPLISPSRLNSIVKSVANTNLALDAENVMIQTNGREIFMGGAERGFHLGASLPMEQDDKDNIEGKFITDYGVTGLKRRSIATNQRIDWQSLHIKLKDLGLHDSISSNANLIREAFEVPNELYKAFQKGSTYENQKEALISFVQRTIQPIADDLASSWTDFFELQSERVVASFDHLPIMQHTEEKKAEKILKIATAFQRLTQSGLSVDQVSEFMETQGVSLDISGEITSQNPNNDNNNDDEEEDDE